MLLCAAVALTSCRSSGIDECYARGRWDCVADLAAIELEREPQCCVCRHHAAVAQQQKALARLDPLQPALTVKALMDAAVAFDQAAVCDRGYEPFHQEAADTRKLYADVVNDVEPAIWDPIKRIEDRDRRIDAVVAHAEFYGKRCTHDLAREYRNYVAHLAARPVLEFRQRLLLMAGTPLAEQLMEAYIGKRVDDGSVKELEVLDQIEADLARTEWAPFVAHHKDTRLRAQVMAARDGDGVNALCSRFPPGADYGACEQRAQALWVGEMERASAERLSAICPRLADPGERDRCETYFSERALRAAERQPTAANMALARRACRDHEVYYRAWAAFVFRHDARASFEKLVGEVSRRTAATPDNVELWENFAARMDNFAGRLFHGETETLLSLDEDLYDQIKARVAALRAEANARYQLNEGDCVDLVVDSQQERRPELIRCETEMNQILEIDQRHTRARDLLTRIETRLNKRVPETNRWKTAFMTLVLGELMHVLVPPPIDRVFYRAWKAVHP